MPRPSSFPLVLKFLRLSTLAILFLLGLGFLVVMNQERLIFPGVTLTPPPLDAALPSGIRPVTIKTADGETLSGYTSVPVSANEAITRGYVGLIFHGNGELASQLSFMPFFAAHGIPALTFDYRGYGHSSGWPSESGIYEDARAAAHYLSEISGLPYERFIVLGNSIGAGPAAFIAREITPHALIILAGYSDLPRVVRETTLYGNLAGFLRFEFPVASFLGEISRTCVVLAHGARDRVIPTHHLDLLAAASAHLPRRVILRSPEAGHNDLYSAVKDQLGTALIESCDLPAQKSD